MKFLWSLFLYFAANYRPLYVLSWKIYVSICHCLKTFKVSKIHTNKQNIIFTYCDQKSILYKICWFSLALISSTVAFNSTFKCFFGLWRIFGNWDIQILNTSINWVTNIYVDVFFLPVFLHQLDFLPTSRWVFKSTKNIMGKIYHHDTISW